MTEMAGQRTNRIYPKYFGEKLFMGFQYHNAWSRAIRSGSDVTNSPDCPTCTVSLLRHIDVRG